MYLALGHVFTKDTLVIHTLKQEKDHPLRVHELVFLRVVNVLGHGQINAVIIHRAFVGRVL